MMKITTKSLGMIVFGLFLSLSVTANESHRSAAGAVGKKHDFESHLKLIGVLMSASYEDVMTNPRIRAAAIADQEKKQAKEAAEREYRRQVEYRKHVKTFGPMY